MINFGFPKQKLNPDVSKNPSDFGSAKNCGNLTTLGFRFDH